MSADEDDDSIESVEEQAADWIVRQDGEGLSALDQSQFAAWIGHPAHLAAYERHRTVWQRYRDAGPAMALARVRERAARQPLSRSGRAFNSRRLAWPAIAASIALVVMGYAEDWPLRLRADFATAVGERRSVMLADGSAVQLGARSAIAFERSQGRRVVRLLQGEAAFQVAADRAHPFTVEAETGSVTALGTAFAIRRRGDRAELVVTQHSVELRPARGERLVLSEGEGTVFGPEGAAAPRTIDVRLAMAWTRGRLVVVDRPLGDVVAEIARERRVYWTVRGEAAAIRVNGVYDLDHPFEAIDLLEKTLKLRSFRLSDRLIILSR